MNYYGYGLEILYDSSIYVFDSCFRYMFVLSTVNFVRGGECGEIVIVRRLFLFCIFMFVEFVCVAEPMSPKVAINLDNKQRLLF